MRWMRISAAALCALLLSTKWAPAQTGSPFATPVMGEDLDAAAFTQWADGHEYRIDAADGGIGVVWTQTTAVRWDGIRYGDTRTPGIRHMRIGFKRSMVVGAVLVRGGGRLSVLKPGAAYPGDLTDERSWLPGRRLRARGAVDDEVGGDEYAIWVLPPGITTRALRFSHIASPTEERYGGWLGGAFVLAGRYVEVAGQARASASANSYLAGRLNDGTNNETWMTWDNAAEGAPEPVSAQHPVLLTLTWQRPVSVRGLCALWAGFGAADALVRTGPPGADATGARQGDWRLVRSFDGIDNQYSRTLGPSWLDFGETVTTRAVRLRITAATRESHPHLEGKTRGGRRVWLGELMALASLGDGDLKSVLPAIQQAPTLPHPPIPVRFTLPEPGYVTLVVENASTGMRVRNLVSETPFPAGANTVWWDGLDDLSRDREAARHGIYEIPARPVPAGSYRIRGLWRKAVHLRYEFSVYNAGHPAWGTADGTGGWLTNHTPPQAGCFLPGDRAPGGKPLMYLGSYVSEGGSGLAWTDMEGRKVGGLGSIGGAWTAAPFLCRDDGPERVSGDILYVGAPWFVGEDGGKQGAAGELRVTALTAAGGERQLLKYVFDPVVAAGVSTGERWISQMGGIAARNGRIVVSLTKRNELLFADAAAAKVVGSSPLKDPRGLAFDSQGRLLVLSGNQLVRLTLRPDGLPGEPEPEPIVTSGLDNPVGIALDRQDRIYVTDRGGSHQVKVFASDGRPLRTIGHPGAPRTGPYDPLHMNNPAGLDLDARGRIWVTEADYSPKRVSLWSPEGRLLKAFYGPAQYGGGGTLDPKDPTRFYYSGVEFRLDWKTGRNVPIAVYFRRSPAVPLLPDGPATEGGPETPLYAAGRQYMTNCYDSDPTNGAAIAMLWKMQAGIARPVAVLGRANDWSLLKTAPFLGKWPAGADPHGEYWQNQCLFAWSDLNGDGAVQPDEVQIVRASVGGVTVAPDLGMAVSRVGSRAVLYPPVRFTRLGAPVYDLSRGRTLATGVQSPPSSGGDQVLRCPDGWTVLTVAPKPFAPEGPGGVYKGKALWSYPSLWPGLHASHESPAPDRPGELVGTTRLLGSWIVPKSGQAGPLWAVNGNMGSMYLFTSDGLFVATLFRDIRQGRSWSMPSARRGMLLDDVSPHDENFWPSISETPDGGVYLVDGGRTSVVRVEGLDTIRRLPSAVLRVTAGDIQRAHTWNVEAEAARQRAQGRSTLRVALLDAPPGLDGWEGVDWADVDRRGVAAWFNSSSKPYEVTAALAASRGNLYALYRTDERDLLRNSGETPLAPFKTGGALDLMIGTDPGADPKRTRPVAGDVRLLVTRIGGQVRAVLYRAVVPGTRRPVPFSSPWRTVNIDRVEDVSDQVQLVEDGKGSYELSVPLAVLGLSPRADAPIKADVGILRGDGATTTQRVYWSNKATGITADVPSEAELTPNLWGTWEFLDPVRRTRAAENRR